MATREKTITYLKIVTIFWIIMSIYGVAARTFDPTGFMESQLATRLYGALAIPDNARGPFEFVMILYSVTSITALIMQYAILHYVFPRREKWGFWVLFDSWALWLVTVGAIHAYLGNYFYLQYAVLPIALMLLLPIAYTWPHFSQTKTTSLS